MSEKKAKGKDSDQRARFIAAAKELECDQTGQAFEEAFERIAPPPTEKPEKVDRPR